jgi:hypothetical protein
MYSSMDWKVVRAMAANCTLPGYGRAAYMPGIGRHSMSSTEAPGKMVKCG